LNEVYFADKRITKKINDVILSTEEYYV